MNPEHLAYFDAPGPTLADTLEREAAAKTVVIPYVSDRELVELDPEGVYARGLANV